MVKYHAPRRGSLGFRRKRARRIYPQISSWPEVDKVTLLGYPAYKVGMVSVQERNLLVSERAMWYNLERVVAATVLEAPPIRIIGLRAYSLDPYGLKSLTEVWTPYFSRYERKYLKKKLPLPNKSVQDLKEEMERKIKMIEEAIDNGKVEEIRAIVRTSPNLTTIGKKKPEVLEIKIGGDPKEAFKWGLEKLGKFVRVFDVFEPGMFVDTIAVTKGKGFAGVVKRFGVTLLPPKSKKGRRRIGTLGPWTPGRIMWTVPRPGQLGFFRRTEFNKQIMAIVPYWYKMEYRFDAKDVEEAEPYELERIEAFKLKDLKVDEETREEIITKLDLKSKDKEPEMTSPALKINPKGGWPHYGVIRNDVIVLRGSCQGPPKRLVFLRYPIRPKALRKDVNLLSIYYGRELLLSSDDLSQIFELIPYLSKIQAF